MTNSNNKYPPVSAASLLVWAIVLNAFSTFLAARALGIEMTSTSYSDPPTGLWVFSGLVGIAGLIVLCRGVYRLVIKIEDAARGVMDHVYE